MAQYQINGVTLEVPDHILNDKIAAKMASGGYEALEAAGVQARVREGNRVMEFGSGVGYIASLAAGITGGENVVTVEANPDMIPVIRDNLDRNGHKAATLIHAAVTGLEDAEPTISFERKKSFWSARLAGMDSNPDAVVDVPMVQLHPLLAQYRPHVVIMDIEGAEAHLFDHKWPRHVRVVMMELHPKQYPDTVIKRIVDCMSASGLTYDPGPSRGRILGFRRIRHAE
ncbi:MAG: FkbM family methyltransferase [Roseovarius sp.]